MLLFVNLLVSLFVTDPKSGTTKRRTPIVGIDVTRVFGLGVVVKGEDEDRGI